MPEVSEELRALAAKHQDLQRRTEAIREEMNMVQASIASCDRAIQTIKELKKTREEKGSAQTMVPLGFGSFAHAEVQDIDKIVVNLGAGYSAEKPADEAVETLDLRKEQLGKILEQMNASLAKFVQAMQALEAEVASKSRFPGQQGQQAF